MTRLALAAILATSAQAEPVNLTNTNIEGDKAELHMESTAMGVLTHLSCGFILGAVLLAFCGASLRFDRIDLCALAWPPPRNEAIAAFACAAFVFEMS